MFANRKSLTAVFTVALLLGGCASATPTPTRTPTPQPPLPTPAEPSAGPSLSAPPAASESATSSPTVAAPSPSPARFATPEDAVGQYLDGVKRADVSTILSACAIDEASAGFSFSAQADWLKVMQLAQNPGPAQYPFYADMNRTLFTDRILSQARMLSYSLLSTTPVDANPVLADKAKADAFATQVDPARLAGLSVLEIRFPNARFENDSHFLANSKTSATIYGADDSTQRLALFSLAGTDYEAGFTLFHYADGWKVLFQMASLSDLPSLGTAQPITADEFDRQTSGN